jgi:hypothetical protein
MILLFGAIHSEILAASLNKFIQLLERTHNNLNSKEEIIGSMKSTDYFPIHDLS